MIGFVLLLAFCASSFVKCEEAKVQLNIEKIDIQMVDNPYFGDWTAELFQPGDQMSFKLPVKEDLPDDIRINSKFIFSGSEVPEVDSTICDALEDETFGKGIVQKGEPAGEFPTACPFLANDNYEIAKYLIESEKIPSSLPDGPMEGTILIYMPDSLDAPIMTIKLNGELFHKASPPGR